MLEMAWYIAIHDHDISVTQHGLASCVTKFERQSFRLHSKFGVARKLLAQSASVSYSDKVQAESLFCRAALNTGELILPKPVLQCISAGSLHACMKRKSA